MGAGGTGIGQSNLIGLETASQRSVRRSPLKRGNLQSGLQDPLIWKRGKEAAPEYR